MHLLLLLLLAEHSVTVELPECDHHGAPRHHHRSCEAPSIGVHGRSWTAVERAALERSSERGDRDAGGKATLFS